MVGIERLRSTGGKELKSIEIGVPGDIIFRISMFQFKMCRRSGFPIVK